MVIYNNSVSFFAAIDIGSNTIRLLVGNVRDNRINDVLYERRITRLAEGVNQFGNLRTENIEASLLVLREFSSLIEGKGVKTACAVATSALREANNADIFIEKVHNETGISIKVISGEKEAELTMKGILLSFSNSLFMYYPSLIFDIGGGSTEWILCRDMHPAGMGSIPIGVVKLHEKFIKSDPVSVANVSELEREILLQLEILNEKIGHHISRETIFIGTAGTFTTLAAIDLKLEIYDRDKVHLHRIPLSRLYDMRKKLFALSLEERKRVKGLEPGRADLIIPGIQFTIRTMEFFKFDELIVSEYGLLEGLLLEAIQEKNEKGIPETLKP
jgi:exopolyphosphatase/guanosine-5'-triphosphate,3'-diphosphate pyrophosphatase